MDALDWFSFVVVGFEHLNLEGLIRTFLDTEQLSAWDKFRTYPRFFLNGGGLR